MECFHYFACKANRKCKFCAGMFVIHRDRLTPRLSLLIIFVVDAVIDEKIIPLQKCFQLLIE